MNISFERLQQIILEETIKLIQEQEREKTRVGTKRRVPVGDNLRVVVSAMDIDAKTPYRTINDEVVTEDRFKALVAKVKGLIELYRTLKDQLLKIDGEGAEKRKQRFNNMQKTARVVSEILKGFSYMKPYTHFRNPESDKNSKLVDAEIGNVHGDVQDISIDLKTIGNKLKGISEKYSNLKNISKEELYAGLGKKMPSKQVSPNLVASTTGPILPSSPVGSELPPVSPASVRHSFDEVMKTLSKLGSNPDQVENYRKVVSLLDMVRYQIELFEPVVLGPNPRPDTFVARQPGGPLEEAEEATKDEDEELFGKLIRLRDELKRLEDDATTSETVDGKTIKKISPIDITTSIVRLSKSGTRPAAAVTARGKRGGGSLARKARIQQKLNKRIGRSMEEIQAAVGAEQNGKYDRDTYNKIVAWQKANLPATRISSVTGKRVSNYDGLVGSVTFRKMMDQSVDALKKSGTRLLEPSPDQTGKFQSDLESAKQMMQTSKQALDDYLKSMMSMQGKLTPEDTAKQREYLKHFRAQAEEDRQAYLALQKKADAERITQKRREATARIGARTKNIERTVADRPPGAK